MPLLSVFTPFTARASARRSGAVLLLCLASLSLAGCFGTTPKRVTYEPEVFDSTTTHTRTYPATEAQTCEAARRALLSQGYLLTAANSELVTGKKSFQPAFEVHVEVELRVVCARQDKGERATIAFATAVQDRFGMKKAATSASVGVGAIGSLSLPFSQSDDAMIKVASETVTDERFYDRFFVLIDRFLVAPPPPPGVVDTAPQVPAPKPAAEPPKPVEPASVAPPTVPVPAAPDRG